MRVSFDNELLDLHGISYDNKSKSTLDSDRSTGSNGEAKDFFPDDEKQDEFEIEYIFLAIYVLFNKNA